jgi:ubiquinone/menaquinone biosynthesis C-methylase UbiE
MMEINRKEVLMPGGKELTSEVERYLNLCPEKRLLSVACGTGEIECNLAEKYGCQVVGIDITEKFISTAQKKTEIFGLNQLVQFKAGDGNALDFTDESFDVIFCSGALCVFFDNGLAEFHRVLKLGGRAAIIDVVWTIEQVPEDIEQFWTEGVAKILTLDGNYRAFASRGFKVIFAQAYHKPSWWEAYFDDRGDAPIWQKERANYQAHKDYIALSLFVIEKERRLNGVEDGKKMI